MFIIIIKHLLSRKRENEFKKGIIVEGELEKVKYFLEKFKVFQLYYLHPTGNYW